MNPSLTLDLDNGQLLLEEDNGSLFVTCHVYTSSAQAGHVTYTSRTTLTDVEALKRLRRFVSAVIREANG